MIETRDIWFSYGNREVLKGLNFMARQSEVTVVMGKNGAGKTTLLLHLNGLLRPKKGEVRLNGVRVSYDKRALFELRKKVALVFQNPDDQIIAPTVWEEVAFGPANAGLNLENAKRALKLVGLEGYEERLCSQLSGGEKKRLSIADAIAMDPDFVVMDEPTAGLDQPGFDSIVELILMLRELGKGVVIATHDLELATKVGDRFYYLDAGKVVYEGESIDYRLAKRLGIRGFAGMIMIASTTDTSVEQIVNFNGDSEHEILEKTLKAVLKAYRGESVLLKTGEGFIEGIRRILEGLK
jgi:cobalt/nickel transport system ATP-binding protein